MYLSFVVYHIIYTLLKYHVHAYSAQSFFGEERITNI